MKEEHGLCDVLDIRGKVAKFIVVNRLLADKTQTNIASQTRRTFQQIQKYENATNNISSDILLFICAAFKYDMHYLLNGNPEELINKLEIRDQMRCRAKFVEINDKVIKHRERKKYYDRLLPKLEAEMNYVVTYKDPK